MAEGLYVTIENFDKVFVRISELRAILKLLNFLLNISCINDLELINQTFGLACDNNKLDVAKLLYREDGDAISADEFIIACPKQYLEY